MANLQSFRNSQDSVALENLDLKNKNILARVDYNCPVGNLKVLNNFRIRESLKTLENLKEAGARKITLVTHFERPEGKYDSSLSLEPIRRELEKLWGEKVTCPEYTPDFNQYAKQLRDSTFHVSGFSPSGRTGKFQVFMWENIRFWAEEEKNDSDFARTLAQNQDIFINEAFSASHREHASVVGVARLLPAYAGWRLAEEARMIYQLTNGEAVPSVAIVGGAKIETKIPVLKALAKNYDQIILGGKIAIEYEELRIKNEELRKNNFSPNWTEKVVLPTGYLGEEKFDISRESAESFAQIIRKAKKIIWNGPMGQFEKEEYRQGSEIVARAVAENKDALRLIGGGDTVELLEQLGLQNQVGFVSTGGGAMLEYIANGTLPGLEELEY
jgi:phosphoglycerate kinase